MIEQFFDHSFGQGFDQIWGEEKRRHTLYRSTGPQRENLGQI